jgi:asparagine synthetase B (glutamine-hydrolysing)
MCGIHVFLSSSSTSCPDWLRRRGPDYQGNYLVGKNVNAHASVLHMRAQQPAMTLQPVLINNENVVLCWNGEVYETCTTGDVSTADDTLLVAALVRSVFAETTNSQQHHELLRQALATLTNAEYAIAVVTATHVYYARDKFGTRSLLVKNADSLHTWELASVATTRETGWTEVPPNILYCYHVDANDTIALPTTKSAKPLASLLQMDTIDQASRYLQHLLCQAVRLRIAGATNVGVLFSGGLDSVVLAALALECFSSQTKQQLKLVNVSFYDSSTTTSVIAADTIAAHESHKQLQALYPQHTIVFTQCNISWEQVLQETPRIQHLLYPKQSTMDYNIATAFWFAAQAATDARLLLSGLGADEQMAGYSRHKTAYIKGGSCVVREELTMDVQRLWDRNLGRDDRVLSDCSKEVRYPYLDSNVTSFLKSLPVELLCEFSKPELGDKRILRLVAERMGLTAASRAMKRAIQFGSRVAQVADKKRFGSRRKATGQGEIVDSIGSNNYST